MVEINSPRAVISDTVQLTTCPSLHSPLVSTALMTSNSSSATFLKNEDSTSYRNDVPMSSCHCSDKFLEGTPSTAASSHWERSSDSLIVSFGTPSAPDSPETYDAKSPILYRTDPKVCQRQKGLHADDSWCTFSYADNSRHFAQNLLPGAENCVTPNRGELESCHHYRAATASTFKLPVLASLCSRAMLSLKRSVAAYPHAPSALEVTPTCTKVAPQSERCIQSPKSDDQLFQRITKATDFFGSLIASQLVKFVNLFVQRLKYRINWIALTSTAKRRSNCDASDLLSEERLELVFDRRMSVDNSADDLVVHDKLSSDFAESDLQALWETANHVGISIAHLPHWCAVLQHQTTDESQLDLRGRLCMSRKETYTLMRHPWLTLRHFLSAVMTLMQALLFFCIRHCVKRHVLTPLILLLILFFGILLSGQYFYVLASLSFYLKFVSWWLGLGVLSSVGFGCGLPSGVLFLFPFIYSVCLTSEKCNSLSFDPTISMWSNQIAPGHTFECGSKSHHKSMWDSVTFLGLFWVCLPATLLWGLGTAIGELPPYAASYAAAESRQDEFFEDDFDAQLRSDKDLSLWSRPKKVLTRNMYQFLKRHGVFAVFVLSSWPNALFDICGMLCGHFMMPFWDFFLALVLGKGVVKVVVQLSALIFIFSKRFDKQRAHLVSLIANIAPFSSWIKSRFGTPEEFEKKLFLEIQKLRTLLTAGSVAESTNNNEMSVWRLGLGIAVTFFMIYFTISLIEQMAQSIIKKYDDQLLVLLTSKKSTDSKKCTLDHENQIGQKLATKCD